MFCSFVVKRTLVMLKKDFYLCIFCIQASHLSPFTPRILQTPIIASQKYPATLPLIHLDSLVLRPPFHRLFRAFFSTSSPPSAPFYSHVFTFIFPSPPHLSGLAPLLHNLHNVVLVLVLFCFVFSFSLLPPTRASSAGSQSSCTALVLDAFLNSPSSSSTTCFKNTSAD